MGSPRRVQELEWEAELPRLREEVRRERRERRRVEEELRRQRDLHEALLRAQSEAGEGLVIAEGARVSYANEAFCRISGYTEEELLGLPTYFELFRPEDRAAFVERFERRMAGGGGEDRQELTLLRKDGQTVELDVAVKELRSEGTPRFVVVARDVSGRRRIEEELRASEERYRAVIEQAAEGIVLVDADDKRVLEANSEFRRMLGLKKGEVAGLSMYDFVSHDRRSVDENIELTLKKGSRVVGERRYRRKDGASLDVMVSASAVSYGGRRVVSLVIRDITRRKRAEEELRRSERSLATAQRIARLGNFEYDVRLDRARWSDELYRIFGHEPQSFTPGYRAFMKAVHPADRERLREVVRGVWRTGRSGSARFRIVRPDGRVRHVDTNYEARRAGEAGAVVLAGTVQDVTQRELADRRIREAEARFRTLVEQVPAIVYIQEVGDPEEPGAEKQVQYISPQYKDVLGYPQERETNDGSYWLKIMHPDDRERVLAEDARTDATGEPFRMEYRQYASDGRLIWIRDEAVLVRDDEGEPLYWLGVLFDVTERKHAEEELRRRAEELARSNAELERFAYVASHDLQEPLRMVSSYTQLLARRYEGRLDEDADEFIRYAVDGATRMQALINDLLAYSRVGTRAPEPSPTDLGAAFEAVRNNLRVAIEESGASVVAEGLPVVRGDETQLVQLLQNLIGNSIKFRGGRPPEVRVAAERHGPEWVVSVRDNGVGFEEEYADRIFVVFQRLHAGGGYAGTGIGLAICKKIVERHGGRIWAESEPGKGSTFYFTLPAAGGDPA
jgi:PAS domain S-box-containing protein